MKNSLLITALLFVSCCVAQVRKPLHGKVIITGDGVMGIFIINKSTGTETKSGADGLFTIEAKPGDKLAVFHKNIVSRDFVVSDASFEANPYVLEAEPKGSELQEVVITGVTSESLGLVPKGQKKVTEADRKLIKYSSGGGLIYLINALTGKLKPLKRARETVKKQVLKDQVWNMITEADIKQCGISAEMAKGFIFYAIEDKRVKAAVDSGSGEIKLLLIEIAEEYLKLQKVPCIDC
jgi:hypothetical protein